MFTGGPELPATLSLPEKDPVSGTITGTGEAVFFDKGFQQDGVYAVLRFPVGWQRSGRLGEDHRGKVGGAYPEKDQEACVVDDAMQVLLA